MVIFSAFIIPAFAGPFSDVPSDHWAYDAVNNLKQKGIVVGYPDGTFGGDKLFTRYEMAMVVARMYDQFCESLYTMNYGFDYDLYFDYLEDMKDDFDNLLDEFSDELGMIGYEIDDMKDWMWDVDDRVALI